MGFTLKKGGNVVAGGKTLPFNVTETGDALGTVSDRLPVAKIGQLTTRTDNNTGTLTMASGHGITTGQKLDIYWDGGTRRTVTVGTVSGLSVPIDLGAGDNLPTNNTAITAQVPTTYTLGVDGDKMTALACGGDSATNQFTFQLADDTEELSAVQTDPDNPYIWNLASGVTNPLAGVAPTKVLISNGDSAKVSNVTVLVLADN